MKLKIIIPWSLLCIVFLIGASAATKQMIGPSTPTTSNSIVRWTDSSAYKTKNSVVTIDDNGNMSGIATQTMGEADVSIAYMTNGFIFLQKSSAPTAATIGGTIGSVTNYMIMNLNGALMKYWSDGTSLYSQEIGTH